MESNHHLKVRSFVYVPLYERGKTWQDYQGSNLERLSQSQLCYHYTIVQQINWYPMQDLNLRPTAYQAAALPLS